MSANQRPPTPFAVITSGQTGAGIAALCVARAFHVATGGTAPRGWRIEQGSAPELQSYGLVQSQSDDYEAAHRANVEAADAILLFRSAKTEQLDAIEALAAEREVPVVINPKVEGIAGHLTEARPSRLFIAGNTEAEAEHIGWRLYLHIGKGFRQAGLAPDTRMVGNANPLLKRLPRPPES